MPCNPKYLERPKGLSIFLSRPIMILEILTWGFFSAWGWFGASYVKDQVWPPEAPVAEQKAVKKDINEQSQNSGK
jgi:hypothetical protein